MTINFLALLSQPRAQDQSPLSGFASVIDGDTIAVLCADFVMEHMRVLPPVLEARGETFSFAVVQTAYANGGSTRYLESIGLPPKLAKTGVKFLHHCADKYDLSIYFEANGHGTVMFKDVVLERLTALRSRMGAMGAAWEEEEEEEDEMSPLSPNTP